MDTSQPPEVFALLRPTAKRQGQHGGKSTLDAELDQLIDHARGEQRQVGVLRLELPDRRPESLDQPFALALERPIDVAREIAQELARRRLADATPPELAAQLEQVSLNGVFAHS
jgi:hypothetical protein